MTTFDMNNAVDNAFGKMDIYAIYLRKSRADMEAEKLGEGETLARHKKILTELAARKGLYIGKIYQEIVSGNAIDKALGGKPRKSHAKRFEKGINIIGKKNKDIG